MTQRRAIGTIAVVAFLLGVVETTRAGSFLTDFSTQPANATLLLNANVSSGRLDLTPHQQNQYGTMLVDDLDPGQAITSFSAAFDIYISAYDGLSLSYGPMAGITRISEGGAGGKLRLSFDRTLHSSVGGVRLYYESQTVIDYVGAVHGASWKRVSLSVDPLGNASLAFGSVLADTGTITNWSPEPGWQFAFGARTGALTGYHYVDNLSITTESTPAVPAPIAAIAATFLPASLKRRVR